MFNEIRTELMKLQTYKMYDGEDTVYVERDDVLKLLEQEPCEDAISRQAVLDAMNEVYCHIEMIKKRPVNKTEQAMYLDMIGAVKSVPSVTPQPKTGEWLENEVIDDKVIKEWQSARCSVCDKYHTTPYMYYFSHYDYCPHCGAKMEVEE